MTGSKVGVCGSERQRDSDGSGIWAALNPTLTQVRSVQCSQVGCKMPEWSGLSGTMTKNGLEPMQSQGSQPSRCRGKFEHGFDSKMGDLLEALGVSPGQTWLGPCQRRQPHPLPVPPRPSIFRWGSSAMPAMPPLLLRCSKVRLAFPTVTTVLIGVSG